MRTAHRVVRSIRRIMPSELPIIRDLDGAERAATDAELLNMDIICINAAENLYTCADQDYLIDGAWVRQGVSSPGIELSQGFLEERHQRLPDRIKRQVFRALVIRSSDPTSSARDFVAANLSEVGAALISNVGLIDEAPLVDTTSPDSAIEEAQRLAAMVGSGLERTTVPMADVTDGDFVEADSLVPYSWAGEPKS